MERVMFGSIETVSLPDFGVSTLAKVDTGAWTGALHCTNIYEDTAGLHFTPLGEAGLEQVAKTYESRMVRSATGHKVKRYIVPFTLEIKGKTYHTTLGLSDRTMMQREMLLGRKFLIENKIIVDVTLTLDDDYEAEKYL